MENKKKRIEDRFEGIEMFTIEEYRKYKEICRREKIMEEEKKNRNIKNNRKKELDKTIGTRNRTII